MKSKINFWHLYGVTTGAIVLGLATRHFSGTSWPEFAALVASIVWIYLAAVEHLVNWPVGILSVVLYIWVFAGQKLYADTSLQCLFLVLSFHGWWLWTKGESPGPQRLVSRIRPLGWVWIVVGWVLGTAAYTPLIKRLGGSSALLDSTLTVASVIAQILLNQKKLENWMVWILVDACYVPFYLYKQLVATAILSLLYTVLAGYGWYTWVKTTAQPVGITPAA